MCDETLGLLREILSKLSFIQNYELIRVLHQKEQICTYQRHVGLAVTQYQLTLPENIRLKPGQFYLNKQNKEFLELDPLLVFWQITSSPLIADTSDWGDWDTGIFEHFISNQLMYRLSNLWEEIEDKERVVAFVDLIFNTIQQREQTSREVEKLTWWELQEIAKDISQQRMKPIQEKYNPQLYLQRNKVKSAFDDFLSSKKRGFILLGKSGVGKSNFLLALADEFGHEHPNVSLLMFDATYLDPEKSLTSIVNEAFNDYLRLPGGKTEHIWREIAKIDDIERRTVLLCIDAINENPQGQALLKQVYDLIQRPWRWLKIVVTSRPEPWYRYEFKYGVKPPKTLLYQEANSNKQAVEMEPFTYSQKLEPFTRDELRQVYEKYRQVYKLQTPYKALSEAVRQLLRDPLILFLVAQSDKTIPENIRKVDVIPKYIQKMIETGQLGARDEQFLKEKLVPLMRREGDYTNAITAQDIDRAGQKLFKEINVERKLSDGRQVNQSFVNLINAEMLVRRDEPSNYQIRFKYERFYEYYLGQHIFEVNATATDKLGSYKPISHQITKASYTWGAIANALRLELQEGHRELIQNLALGGDRTVSGVLLDAIVDFSEIDTDQARQLLLQLITLKQEALNAKRLAIEAASRLVSVHWVENKEGYIEVLELAAKNTNRTVREMAILPVYSFWERDNQLGYMLLNNLARETTNWLKLPRLGLIEFLLQISLLIYGKNIQRNPQLVKSLLELWRTVFKQFSWLIPNKKHKGFPANFFKRSISGVMLKIVSAAIASNLSGEAGKAIPDFFKWSDTDREKVAHMAKFLDVNFGELSEIQEDILYLAPRGNGITHAIIHGITLMHLLENKEKALPIVKYLHDSSNDLWSQGATGGGLALFNIVSNEVDTQIFELTSRWSLDNWRSENLFDPGSHVVLDLLIEAKLGLDRSDHLVSMLDISSSFDDARQLRDVLGIIEALKVVGLKGYPQYALNRLLDSGKK